MNGSIMGMTKQEITHKLDEIVDFAGVERYLDTPVKRYSSGMTVRLGFAVAAFMEPEILVVDEVLAVGDAEFQKKAIGKMQDVSKGEGRTVLFVSHNMASVRSLCNKGVVLNDGQLIHESNVSDAVEYYLTNSKRDLFLYDFHSREVSNKDVFIKDFQIVGLDQSSSLSFCDKFRCDLTIVSRVDVSFTARVTVFDLNDNRTMAFDTSDLGEVFSLKSEESRVLHCTTDESMLLKPGHYKVNVSIRQGAKLLDHIVGAGHFEIREEDFFGFGHYNASDYPNVLKHHNWTM